MDAPSSKHNKDPEAKIEVKSKLKYYIEDKMSIEQIGKGFEGNKDQIKDNIMKISVIFIPMIVSIENSQNPSLLGTCPGLFTDFGMGYSIVDPLLTLSKIHLNLVSFQIINDVI